jgi:DNA-binding beta-propeller fold protein YncE
VAHPQIAIFARLAKDNATPTRLLFGQKTRLSRTMHDIRYDPVHDELLTTNPFAAAILVFRGGANGEEAPIRIIQGPHTELDGPARVEVDPIHNEIIVPNSNSILVFPREANGDIAPIRVLRGPDTRLHRADSVAVDPVHDLLIAAITKFQGLRGMGGGANQGWSAGWTETAGGEETGGLLIFNRTDQGNVKPRAVIQGPRTGLLIPEQLQAYPPRDWIIAAQSSDTRTPEPDNTFVGVWSIHDSGDVPPRWKIGGLKSGIKKPRGVALNPANKELIVADMRRNAVLTFYFPEIF